MSFHPNHPPSATPRHSRRFGRHPRFNLSTLVFMLGAAALHAGGMSMARAIVLAFVAAALLFLLLIGHMFAHSRDVHAIRARARQEDQGRLGQLWTSLGMSVVVLVALVVELRAGHEGRAIELALAGSALALAWLFMNTMFALHYAHRYYGDGAREQPAGGLVFPGNQAPDYWDFLYFALIIGMTFQVSDVQIESRALRRVALLHGLTAFVFNMLILAMSVNVVAGTI